MRDHCFMSSQAGTRFFNAALALSLLIVGSLALGGCFGGKKEKRGIRYMPDMYESPALKSNEAYRIKERDENGQVIRVREVPGMLPPPPGAIARNLVYTAPSESWRDEEHARNANPLPLTRDNILLGRAKYEAYCAVCHGPDGNVENNYLGDKVSGIISINIEAVAEMTDGHYYDVISHGIRRMPGYKAQLLPDERWAVIHYLRVLQQATQLSDEERERLMGDERAGDFADFALPPPPVPEYEQRQWPEYQQ